MEDIYDFMEPTGAFPYSNGEGDYQTVRWPKYLNNLQGVSHAEWRLLAVIATRYNSKTNTPCWPKNETLAHDVEMTIGTIKVLLSSLRKKGFLRSYKSEGKRYLVVIIPEKS